MKMISRVVALSVLVAMVTEVTLASLSNGERLEALSVGLGNVEREIINGVVAIDQGQVPTWLNGDFIRHSCGAFGETQHQDFGQPNFISHLFDCITTGSKFRLLNGSVTFTNRWYDTTVNDIYNYYGRDMNKSSVFMQGTYCKSNASQVDLWSANMSDHSKVTEVPHVSWWMIGDDVIAMTEVPPGVVIDQHSVEQKGYVQFTDSNMGLPEGTSFTNNPAHEHTESDGSLWSSAVSVSFTSKTALKMSRIVYKVGADKNRKVIGSFDFPEIDLARCHGMARYPDMSSRFGYVHSFCITQQYIVIPESAYSFDPCFYTRYQNYEPYFPQAFKYENSGYTRLLVMRKSDGQFIANVTTVPMFITHQLGSYEDGELIHMDMLTYDNAGIYDTVTSVNSLLSGINYTTNVTRITINTTDWSVSVRNLRKDTTPTAFEMSNINYAFNGRKYTYGYMAKNFDRPDQNAITKLNVDTGLEQDYLLPEGLFVQEPQFWPRPGATAEDDGIIMAQGVDGVKQKAFMVIVDARTMTLMAHLTAPDLALLGLHERFFPLPTSDDTNGGSTLIISWLTVIAASIYCLTTTG